MLPARNVTKGLIPKPPWTYLRTPSHASFREVIFFRHFGEEALARCAKLLRLARWLHKDVVRNHGESSEMDEQQVPNLEEMDEQQAERFLVEMFTVLSAEKEYALRHEDYVMEMPQSGESIRGREKMREFQEAYPAPPSIRLRRVLVRDGLWVVEGVNDYGDGQIFDVVLIIELKEGKMWRDRRYYAEPFEAPEWRARWVQRVDF